MRWVVFFKDFFVNDEYVIVFFWKVNSKQFVFIIYVDEVEKEVQKKLVEF